MRRPGLSPALALVAALAGTVAPGCAGEVHHELREHRTLVEGTVLEAATGEALGGVRVTGPGDVSTTTGPDGRFELSLELPEASEHEGGHGDHGTPRLVAEGPDGLRGENPLTGTQRDRLEVVLHLR